MNAHSRFKIRIDGRLQGQSHGDPEACKILSFFERVRVQFPGNQQSLLPIDLIKAKSPEASKYDTLLIERAYPENYDFEKPIEVQISLHPAHHPKKFRLSADL